ncbi:Glycylpeptide N-tetradecanoyltransferase [Talaromyces atroroseus]|uniref:Glycylpeptide N-tetradecanoyltransferase n=1 Tax=Talaromyces atroroseus TaxID=1441469 RepID=A0A225ASU7_TALAT|nr:Glycylpeptide N-tetradecanoyltransferase [Talaromyces atroroseus]OKL61424.1 Glycylpeptide N-tetradecanoyltransferase [Talaromyces atroroseus]
MSPNEATNNMAAYKFWKTQPVPKFDGKDDIQQGPIKIIDPDETPKDPYPLLDGFEWVTLDLTEDNNVVELYNLLSTHYVEDGEGEFRLNYSPAFLRWALTSPGWQKEWHVGVRASKSKKLTAFISGVPTKIRAHDQTVQVVEINFLCIHKKLRSKRLAPLLIKEITRRCYLKGIYQAVYTAAVVLPTPIASYRYFHRPLNWLKLYEAGFAFLPLNSTTGRQVAKYHLPRNTSIPGLRALRESDLDALQHLLEQYLARFDVSPKFTKDEIRHWLFHEEKKGVEQVVWSYVVEDAQTQKLTDFFSFYSLESSVTSHSKHDKIRTAYLYYYASAFSSTEDGLEARLEILINDALIVAKKADFDVFNALNLQDNALFLEKLRFMNGSGELNYYLFNYRMPPVRDAQEKNLPLMGRRGGVGIVLV